MIVCVSPSSQHFDETQNTLRYANRAKNIQTKVTKNVFNVNRHVKDFLVKIDEQMALINELKTQQKESEKFAFAKFQKQTEKKAAVVRESVSRIRNAYEHSLPERQERTRNMLKLRQISHRISILSAWIAAFDNVCGNYEDEEPLSNLQAIRRTAQGILLEFEGSRQHYHQRLSKSNWDRGITSAVDHAAEQLREFEISDNTDFANITREAELLKSNAEREALSAVADQQKTGDVATIQQLLQAQFEAVAAVENIMRLNKEEAIDAGRKALTNMLNTGSSVTTNIVKPDGNSPQAQTFNSPVKSGAPTATKRLSLLGVPAGKGLNPTVNFAPSVSISPVKGSPRRRKINAAKKGVSFSPKKSHARVPKRSVRWKDDEKNGALTEFQRTPKRPDPIPEVILEEETTPSIEPTDADESKETRPPTPPRLPKMSPIPRSIPVPTRSASPADRSSPIPTPPEPTLNIQKNNGRFKAGFLSKKTGGSPLAAPPSNSMAQPDRESTPLQDIENSSFLNRASNERPSRIAVRSSSGNFASSPLSESTSKDESWKASKDDAFQISSAMRRISGSQPGHAVPGGSMRINRRRSPTATTLGSSPPENTMFTASQARRMVKREKNSDFRHSVLSPQTIPVMKNTGRRVTLGGDLKSRDTSLTGRDAIRLSVAAAPRVSRPSMSGSLR